jgi:hypothetical protein
MVAAAVSLLDDAQFDELWAARLRIARLESILASVRRALRSGRPNAVAELIDGIDRGHVKFDPKLMPDKDSVRLDPRWPHVRACLRRGRADPDLLADDVIKALRSGAIPP